MRLFLVVWVALITLPSPDVTTLPLAVAIASAQAGAPETFAKTFVGRLAGKFEVRMHLRRTGDALSGVYSYQQVQDSLLSLRGTIAAGGEIVLEEFSKGRRTGIFRGKLVRRTAKDGSLLTLSGTWSSEDGRRTLPFELVEEHMNLNGAAIVYSSAEIAEEDAKRGFEISAAYPKFEAGRPEDAQKINSAVETLVSGHVGRFRKLAEEWAREQRAADKSREIGVEAELSIDYEVLAFDNGIVSVRFSTFDYFRGTAHPSHGLDVFNYSVVAARRLQLDDLFVPKSRYLDKLSAYCIDDLALEDSSRQGAAPRAENFRFWNLTPQGLQITFAEYQVGPYVAGSPEVTIPWKELARFLRKDGPAGAFLKRN